jgi:hypothetical protein
VRFTLLGGVATAPCSIDVIVGGDVGCAVGTDVGCAVGGGVEEVVGLPWEEFDIVGLMNW